MGYVSRALEARILEVLKTHPVVVLTGPRQVGKSTLLEHAPFLKDWRYLTFDDSDVLEQAREDPKGLLLEDRPTILDEVQRHTPIFLTIKYFADRSEGKRKFLLSGSGNISLRREPRESLAGRAKYLALTPLGIPEILPRKHAGVLQALLAGKKMLSDETPASVDWKKMVWRGGLPKVALSKSVRSAVEILSGYVDTYLQRDIQDLVKVRHPENFRRLMTALAQATGWTTVQEELSRVSREDRSNVSRYISLLKETGLLYEINGYSLKGEKAYKQSKYYWFDSGVACFLSGIHAPAQLAGGSLKGRYFENLVFQQILFLASLQLVAPEIFYWKLKGDDVEVDFVLEHEGSLLPLEIKSSPDLSYRDTRSLRRFLKAHPQAKQALLVYTGCRTYPIATGITAVPWTDL